MKHFLCNLCGSENQKRIFTISVDDCTLRYFFYARNISNPQKMTGNFEIVKCENCGLLRVDPRFERDELGAVYSSDEVTGGGWWSLREVLWGRVPQEGTKNKDELDKTRQLIQSFEYKADLVEDVCRVSDELLHVLDIGCGKGFFLKAMLNRGHKVSGVDLNPERIAFACENLGLQDIHHSDFIRFSDKFPSSKFDVITLWDVIEHVERPLDLVKRVKSLLKPGGHLILYAMTLDSLTYKLFRKRWYYIFPPQHLYYFNSDTMRQLYERSGYKYLGHQIDTTAKFHRIPKALLRGVAAHVLFNIYRSDNSLTQALLRKITPVLNWPDRQQGLKRMEYLIPYYFPLRFRDSATYIGRKIE